MNLPLWLCHQKPERCFKIKKKPMPLCSRCFGLYLFIILGFIISFIFRIGNNLNKNQLLKISILLVFPLFIDSGTQLLRLRKSNNFLRFITGSLAGVICGIDLYYLIIN